MPTTPRRRIIQVGTGGWGHSWAGVIASSPHWEPAALVDLDRGALDAAADAIDLPADRRFTSLGEAADAVEADAVLVAVPPPAHAPVAHEALSRGLHCLVEKPLAETLGVARDIVEHAEEAGLTLMVSQNFRYNRAAQTVRRLIERGVLGRIGAVYIRFFHDPVYTGFRAEMDQPLLVDMSVHHFDQIRGVLGLEPVEVRARTFNPGWAPFVGDSSANVEFVCEGGEVVSYTASWSSRVPSTSWDGEWDVHGERGGLRWARNTVTLHSREMMDTVYLPGARQREGWTLDVDLVDMDEQQRWASLRELAAALDAGRPAETNGRDNLRSLALVLGAVESATTGAPVALEDLAR